MASEDDSELVEASVVNENSYNDDGDEDNNDDIFKVTASFSEEDESIATKIFVMLEEPNSSIQALIISLIINILILISTTTFVLETMPSMYDVDPSVWSISELTCVIAFSADFVIRIICCPNYKAFTSDFMNWIDFIAIVPFYLSLALTAAGVDVEDTALGNLRVIRVLRLVRILKMFKSKEPDATDLAELVGGIAAKSLAALSIPAYFMLSTLVILSSMVYFAEKPYPVTCDSVCGYEDQMTECAEYTTPDDRWQCCYCLPFEPQMGYDYEYNREPLTTAYFQSLPDAYYWGFITMTTVGYGDQFPITWIGRFVAMLIILLGLFFVAMPLSTVGFIFNEDYEATKEKELAREKRERDLKTLKELNQELMQSGQLLKSLTDLSGGKGKIDKSLIEENFDEIKTVMQDYNASAERVQDEVLDIYSVFNSLDVNL